ncbi:MAG TPA: TPM domain-containing protein, partial [Opitutus sp.]|nr:TPM domain-containing protein [Opitutus sp.]
EVAAGAVLAGEVFPAEAAASAAAEPAEAGRRKNGVETTERTDDYERHRPSSMSVFSSTPAIDQSRVVAAIGAAEKRTSGEIRVLLAKHKAADPVETAKRHFERLGMTKTAARNGVLIFLAPASRNFAVIGDTGVHEKCGEGFWQELAKAMTEHFKRGDFTAGLVHGIERAGALLAEHFPRQKDDVNELPDEIEEA